MTQRDEIRLSEEPPEPDAPEETDSKTLRRRGKKSGTGDAGEEKDKAKGRRQRDFDPTAMDEDSDEEKKPSAADEVWTQNQQRLLELALQQYPRGTAERWDRIAKVVPGKSKVSCYTGMDNGDNYQNFVQEIFSFSAMLRVTYLFSGHYFAIPALHKLTVCERLN